MPGHRSSSELIAVLLFALPFFYLASYLAMVRPGQVGVRVKDGVKQKVEPYLFNSALAATMYWPLEQVDRQVRPVVWETSLPPLRYE